MDEVLASVAETIKNFAVIYLVDITEVPDFNTMYELYDPSTVMFFFRNKHIMIDLGTGNNNKINWAMKDKQEFIDIVETVYRGARKGRGLVIAPKDYSTKYRYWVHVQVGVDFEVCKIISRNFAAYALCKSWSYLKTCCFELEFEEANDHEGFLCLTELLDIYTKEVLFKWN